MSEEDDDFIIILQNKLDYTNKILNALNIPEVNLDTDLNNIQKYYNYHGNNKIIPEEQEQEQEQKSSWFGWFGWLKRPTNNDTPKSKIQNQYYYVKLRELLQSETELSNFKTNKKYLINIFKNIENIMNDAYKMYGEDDDVEEGNPGYGGRYKKKIVEYSKPKTNSLLNSEIDHLLLIIYTKTHPDTGGKPSRKKRKSTKRKRTQKKNTKKRSRK
jgi:hypothetical protein